MEDIVIYNDRGKVIKKLIESGIMLGLAVIFFVVSIAANLISLRGVSFFMILFFAFTTANVIYLFIHIEIKAILTISDKGVQSDSFVKGLGVIGWEEIDCFSSSLNKPIYVHLKCFDKTCSRLSKGKIGWMRKSNMKGNVPILISLEMAAADKESVMNILKNRLADRQDQNN